jgi:hypothetical protein
MKKLSNKDSKMCGKARSFESMNSVCWICHQDAGIKAAMLQLSQALQKEYVKPKEAFVPCLCKGSMAVVHQECINQWVLEQYKTKLSKEAKNDQDEELPVICCPNCKLPYDYTVTETRKFNGLKGLRLLSVESVCLFLLIMFQIGVLVYDLYFNKKSVGVENKTNEEHSLYLKLSQYLHVFTVIIVIGAGGFNLLENSQKQIVVQVLSKTN